MFVSKIYLLKTNKVEIGDLTNKFSYLSLKAFTSKNEL